MLYHLRSWRVYSNGHICSEQYIKERSCSTPAEIICAIYLPGLGTMIISDSFHESGNESTRRLELNINNKICIAEGGYFVTSRSLFFTLSSSSINKYKFTSLLEKLPKKFKIWTIPFWQFELLLTKVKVFFLHVVTL